MGSDKNLVDVNDVWFSEDGLNWNKLKNTPIIPRHASAVVMHKNNVYLYSGSNLSRDVWKLSKLNNTPT